MAMQLQTIEKKWAIVFATQSLHSFIGLLPSGPEVTLSELEPFIDNVLIEFQNLLTSSIVPVEKHQDLKTLFNSSMRYVANLFVEGVQVFNKSVFVDAVRDELWGEMLWSLRS